MAVYLGSNKSKIILNNTTYLIQSLITQIPPTTTGQLLSSDNFILTDLNGNILIAKEAE